MTFPNTLNRWIKALIHFMVSLCCGFSLFASEKNDPQSEKVFQELMTSMVWVEGGSFQMGSDDEVALEREKPAHTVTVDSFYIGAYEVTQDLFQEVMDWNVSYFQGERRPVNNISWLNIQLFIERLNERTGQRFRLPTEKEWEYAARGGNKSMGFRYSGSNDIDEVAWYVGNSKRRCWPVGQKKPNELGLYDMTGNLWEFCQDSYSKSSYKQSKDKDIYPPASKDLSLKVTRGSGYEFSPEESYVYRRDAATSNVRMPDIGFRLVLDKKNE